MKQTPGRENLGSITSIACLSYAISQTQINYSTSYARDYILQLSIQTHAREAEFDRRGQAGYFVVVGSENVGHNIVSTLGMILLAGCARWQRLG